MGRKRAVIPKLREVNGYAACWVKDKYIYFGKAGTPEAEADYRSFVAKYAANPDAATASTTSAGILAHLIGEYLKSPDAPRSAEKQAAVAYLINHVGELALRQIEHVTAQDVKALFKRKAEQTRPVKGGGEGDVEPAYCQTTLRRWFADLKRVYLWAIESDRVTADAVARILAIKSLPIQSARREKDIEPVPRADVEKTLTCLNRTVAEMVRMQMLTGMRPSDIFHMTAEEVFSGGIMKIGGMARDLDKEGVWVYIRRVHKTDRYGHVRVILLGEEERAIIEPRIAGRAAAAPLFQPIESVAESYRRTTLEMTRSRIGAKPYNTKWTRQSYAQAVGRAAEKAGVPHWSPYQIRHLVAVEVQAEFGLDAARARLGQKSISITARYADIDFTRAVDVTKNKGKKNAS